MWLIKYVILGLVTGLILSLACKEDVRHGYVINYKQLLFSTLFFPVIWAEVIFFGINFLVWRIRKHERNKK